MCNVYRHIFPANICVMSIAKIEQDAFLLSVHISSRQVLTQEQHRKFCSVVVSFFRQTNEQSLLSFLRRNNSTPMAKMC